MNRFDFSPYRRSMVGFDRLFDVLENQGRAQSGEKYPPFNIEKRGTDAYRITLAVAGFKPGDIDITQRGFERRFELADYVRVDTAELEDGLLVIDLVREVPEAMKPKKIAIGGNRLTVIDGGEEGASAAA